MTEHDLSMPESASRRLRPRLIDTDWLVLREMRPAIEAMADKVTSQGKFLVDIGCGSQPYRSIFESRGGVYTGADFTDGDIMIDAAGVVCAANESADVILSFQVLEHVSDLRTYLGEARRILKNDGALLLSTHGSWFYHPHPADYRRWTRQGLEAELLGYGFQTEECVSLVGPLAFSTLLRLTMLYHACLKIPLAGRGIATTLAVILNIRGYLESRITPGWLTQDNACVYLSLCRPVA